MGEALPNFEADKPREECGVYGMWLNEAGHEAVRAGEIQPYQMLYDALNSQVNRGHQNTGGAASVDGIAFDRITGKGAAKDAITANLLDRLPPNPRFTLGHNRYTTTGGEDGAQPVQFSTNRGDLVFAGNGEFSNYGELISMQTGSEELPSDHWVWGSILADLLDSSTATLDTAMTTASTFSKGAYSIVAMHDKTMVAMRDPHGVRPLYWGRLRDHGIVTASELPTLRLIGIEAEDIREVMPGEKIVVDDSGVQNKRYAIAKPAFCGLEGVYLSKPDDPAIHEMRVRAGEILARHAPVENADLVVPVLGSARVASKAYAEALGIELDVSAIVKKEGAKRNFIDDADKRDLTKKPKHHIRPNRLVGKIVVIADDSIVRGDTLDYLVPRVAAVAEEVHVRSFSPPIVDLCNLGVNLKTQSELLAHRETAEETIERWGGKRGNVKSLAYLSLEGLRSAIGKEICDGCFGGSYPAQEVAVWPGILSHRPSNGSIVKSL